MIVKRGDTRRQSSLAKGLGGLEEPDGRQRA